MADLGADVIRVNGNYEASLAACKTEAESNDWIIVSDTSWKGYREIPMQIMAGYSVMSREIIEQMGTTKPSHIFLPVGVGGLGMKGKGLRSEVEEGELGTGNGSEMTETWPGNRTWMNFALVLAGI